MGEQTILCGVLQTGAILSFDKMVEKGVDPSYAAKLIQYGWETITEALKHGGITNMMDRLANPAKIKAFELSEKLKEILKGQLRTQELSKEVLQMLLQHQRLFHKLALHFLLTVKNRI